MTKCRDCRKDTRGCKQGKDFKESQGCFGPKHQKQDRVKS